MTVFTSLALSGCATLPVSGPTGSEIYHDSKNQPAVPFKIVELTFFSDIPLAEPLPMLATNHVSEPTDLIGPGDILDIEVFEAGVALFGNARANLGMTGISDGSAQAARLPATRVDDEGRIRVPYAGTLQAAGHTTAELALMIRKALHGLSQNPQVVVNIAQNVAGTVIVGGDVGKPGRLPISTVHETLSDAIALSGGYRGDSKDLAARVIRDGHVYEYRLADVLDMPKRDMEVRAGDRIALIRKPLSFTALGAPNRAAVIPFPAAQLSLVEAVAAAGGTHPDLGDAKAIFVFRFIAGPEGKPEPVVYHINMMHAGTYFLAQRFMMDDKDLLYVGNASSNQPSKLIQLVSQLFTPIVGLQSGLVAAGAIP